jgi:hypothetical protein
MGGCRPAITCIAYVALMLLLLCRVVQCTLHVVFVLKQREIDELSHPLRKNVPDTLAGQLHTDRTLGANERHTALVLVRAVGQNKRVRVRAGANV